MQVVQKWKSHTHILTMTWADKKLKLELSRNGMLINASINVPPNVVNTLRRAHEKAQFENTYPEFRQRVMEAGTSTTELTQFLREVER